MAWPFMAQSKGDTHILSSLTLISMLVIKQTKVISPHLAVLADNGIILEQHYRSFTIVCTRPIKPTRFHWFNISVALINADNKCFNIDIKICLQPTSLFTYTGCLADWKVIVIFSICLTIVFLIKKSSIFLWSLNWEKWKLTHFSNSTSTLVWSRAYDVTINSVVNVIMIITTRYPIHMIITTRYPIHIGLNEGIISPMEPHGLPTDVETLADILLAAGYSTHAVGRAFWAGVCCLYNENLRKMAPWLLQQCLSADQQGVSTPLWLLAWRSGWFQNL